jgi:hypothetical protein
MATRPAQLYEEDFYAWTRNQAAALRRLAASRPNLALDFPHLIEEVADLGISQRDAVRSQLRRIIEHCLKLEYPAARDPGVSRQPPRPDPVTAGLGGAAPVTRLISMC